MTKYTIKSLFKTDKPKMVVILKVGQKYYVQEEDSYIYHNLLGTDYENENTELFPSQFGEEKYNSFIQKLREQKLEYQVIDNGITIAYTLVPEKEATDLYNLYSVKRTYPYELRS